jgi:hypothetical protein
VTGVTLRGAAGFATAVASSSQQVTFPASLQAGDTMVIWCAAGKPGLFSMSWTVSGGTFASLADSALTGAGSAQLFWRTATSSDAANAQAGTPYTVTAAVSALWACAAIAYGGTSSTYRFDPPPAGSAQVNPASTAVTVPGITPVRAFDQLLWLGFCTTASGSPAAITPPAGFTPQFSQVSTGTGATPAVGLAAAGMAAAAAGPTGAQDGSLSAAQGNGGLLLAIPAALPGLPAIPAFPAGYGPAPGDFDTWVQAPLTWLTYGTVFRAELENGQPVTAGTYTVIQWDTILEDPYAGWNGSSFSWLAPLTGWYEITVTVQYSVTSAQVAAAVRLSGVYSATYQLSEYTAGGAAGMWGGTSGAIVLPMVAGTDFIQGIAWAGNSTTLRSSNGSYSSIEITYVSQ